MQFQRDDFAERRDDEARLTGVRRRRGVGAAAVDHQVRYRHRRAKHLHLLDHDWLRVRPQRLYHLAIICEIIQIKFQTRTLIHSTLISQAHYFNFSKNSNLQLSLILSKLQ